MLQTESDRHREARLTGVTTIVRLRLCMGLRLSMGLRLRLCGGNLSLRLRLNKSVCLNQRLLCLVDRTITLLLIQLILLLLLSVDLLLLHRVGEHQLLRKLCMCRRGKRRTLQTAALTRMHLLVLLALLLHLLLVLVLVLSHLRLDLRVNLRLMLNRQRQCVRGLRLWGLLHTDRYSV